MFLWSMKILKIFFKSSIPPFPQTTFSKMGTAKATVKWGTCRMSVLTQLRAPWGSHAFHGPELFTKATGHNILARGGRYLHGLQHRCACPVPTGILGFHNVLTSSTFSWQTKADALEQPSTVCQLPSPYFVF